MAVATGRFVVLQTWGPDRSLTILDGVFHTTIAAARAAAEAEFAATVPLGTVTTPAAAPTRGLKPTANFLIVAVNELLNAANRV